MAITARIEMTEQQIKAAVEAWAKAHNLQPRVDTIELHVERGDPGDPREAGYKRQTITFQATIGG